MKTISFGSLFFIRGILLVLLIFSAKLAGQTKHLDSEKMREQIKSDDPVKVEEFFTANPDLVNKEIEMSGYPLIYSIQNCKYKSAIALLKCKANPNIADKYGFSPLHYLFNTAAVFRIPEEDMNQLMEAFTAQKADFKKTISDGRNLIHLLAGQLIQNEEYLPAAERDIEILVKKGVDPKAKYKDKNGKPASLLISIIALAGTMGGVGEDRGKINCGLANFEVLKVLVTKYGMDVDETDANKRTPLIYLLLLKDKFPEEKVLEWARFLIENGANTGAKSVDGERPKDLVAKDSKLYDVIKKTKKIKTGKKRP